MKTLRLAESLACLLIIVVSLTNCSGEGCGLTVIGGGPTIPGQEDIELVAIPPIGSTSSLRGVIRNASPDEFYVAVYIRVAGNWWTKPTFANPSTAVADDGTWCTNITTGGEDASATQIAAFLMPNASSPVLSAGTSALSQTLFDEAVDYEVVDREIIANARMIDFAGERWWVKASESPVGPGPNLFSDSPENVWVDDFGLHLRITERDGLYRSAEIVSMENFGYGHYIFTIASPISAFDPNVVLGLFTWSEDPEFAFREIDIEFSTWQVSGDLPAQFVVQPFNLPGHIFRFDMDQGDDFSTHIIEWAPNSVLFSSEFFDAATSEVVTRTWEFAGEGVPQLGTQNIRMNLWLIFGEPPIDGQEVEVIFSDFEFVPTSAEFKNIANTN